MKPFLITTWYRPPNSATDKLKEFEKLLQQIDYEDKEGIIMGNINIDLAKDSTDANIVELKFFMDLFQYNQKINEPTRVTKDSQTLIDHFYTNFITSAGVSKITISDH
jgi:division protein CdvB (Snf7/Vps24/ESCRT-III family)